jgi:hypothetical protein
LLEVDNFLINPAGVRGVRRTNNNQIFGVGNRTSQRCTEISRRTHFVIVTKKSAELPCFWINTGRFNPERDAIWF